MAECQAALLAGIVLHGCGLNGRALKTWEVTVAVSYVSVAAWVCSAFSLLSIHQQSKLWPVNHFLRVTFCLEMIGHPGQGSAPPHGPLKALPFSPTYHCGWLSDTLCPWCGGNALTCFGAGPVYLLVSVSLVISQKSNVGKWWILEINQMQDFSRKGCWNCRLHPKTLYLDQLQSFTSFQVSQPFVSCTRDTSWKLYVVHCFTVIQTYLK